MPKPKSQEQDTVISMSDVFVAPSDLSDQLRERGIYYITGEIRESSLLEVHQDALLKHLTPSWKDDLTIYVNSPGGECPEAWALVDLLEYVRMNVMTIGIGWVCSAATIILAAGTKGHRVITPNTHVMIHQFSTVVGGNFSQLAAEQKSVELEQRRHIEFWKTHSKFTTEEDVLDHLLTGTDVNLSPEEALDFGIVDYILGKETPKVFKMGNAAPSKKGRRK